MKLIWRKKEGDGIWRISLEIALQWEGGGGRDARQWKQVEEGVVARRRVRRWSGNNQWAMDRERVMLSDERRGRMLGGKGGPRAQRPWAPA
jgi:hypothetical protein